MPVVDVSISRTNPIHRNILYSGFLSDKGHPIGYNAVWSDESNIPISDLHYLKVIRKIDISDENIDLSL